VTAVDTVREVTASSGPYVGLTFFTEDDAALFFGRDREQMVLISNLRASRLTLLYAQSGAGKSSLLRAGVASRLSEMAKRSYEQRGTARNISIVFSSWRDDPTTELIDEIQKAIKPFLREEQLSGPDPTDPPELEPRMDETDGSHETEPYGMDASSEPEPSRLYQALNAASMATGATLLVILDQFEEYFLYRSREKGHTPFADELAACVNRDELDANFLIAIREDAYSGLGDLFKGRISNVYGNYFHLEHLTREAARGAIEKPVASFNELHLGQPPVELEPGLVDAVLGQLGPDQFASDQGGTGRLAGGNGAGPHRDEVAAPYLQLVMKRLWDTARGEHSSTLRLQTLEDLGGARKIVRTHVDRALGDLPNDDREAAVDILHHLVTPSGTKIALAAGDLAEYTGQSAGQAGALLERLAAGGTRILRTVPPPPGRPDGKRFEISHDLLAPAILDWGRRRRAARLEREKEAAERRAQAEKKRARMFRWLAIGSAALLVLAIVSAVVAGNAEQNAQHASDQAKSRGVAAKAEAVLGQDPELSALLALRALKWDRTSEAQTALRDALPQLQLKATLMSPPPQRSAVFSADGKHILTATADGTIRIWDAASDKQLASFAGFGSLNSAAFSPDGTRIVTASDDGAARIVDARTGQVTRLLTPSGSTGYAVSSATFSPDGRLVVTTYADGTARIWDTRTSKQIGPTLFGEQRHKLLRAAFSPDGKLVVTASTSGNARIYFVRTGAQQGMLPGSLALLDAAFSPDSRFIVTACGDGIARIWDVNTHRLVRILAPPANQYMAWSNAWGAAFSPNGRLVVTASGDGVARIWNAASGQPIRVLGTPGRDSLQSADFSPDGKSIVTASAGGMVRVWNVASANQVALLPAGTGVSQLRAAALSPDGKLAVTGSKFGTVTIWKAPGSTAGTHGWQQVNVISQPEGDAVNSVAFSRDGKLLATADQSGIAFLWQVANGLPAGNFLSAEGRPLRSVAFDPADPDLAVTAGGRGGVARIFRASTRLQVASFRVPGSNVYAAAFSPDGKRIVTASSDGYAQVWNAATYKSIGRKFGFGYGIDSVQFSPDGKEIITAQNDGSTDIWSATAVTPAFVRSIREPGTNVANDAAFSPDGSVVVTAGTDGTARGWDSSTGRQVLSFAGHSGSINAVAFGKTEMITVSSDGTARIWDTQPVEQLGLLSGPTGQQVYTATFDPANPRIVATANANGTVIIWDSNQKKAMKVLQVPGAASAEFSSDGSFLVAAGDEQVRIWPMDQLGGSPKVLGTRTCPANNGNSALLDSATFNTDGSLVVTTDQNGSACVWNVSDGTRVQVLTEPVGVSGGVAGGTGVGASAMRWAVFRPNKNQVLTASDDGTARLWDVASGRQLQVFAEPTGEPINDAWFSPAGGQVVTASNDGTARIWSAADGALRGTLGGADRSAVYNAAFSRNGRLVVTCSGSSAVIWSTQSEQPLTKLQYGSTISDCEFSPDGSRVVTAGNNGQTRIFSTELDGGIARIMQFAQQRTTQPLTPSEQKQENQAAG